jgi:hypothetical protein
MIQKFWIILISIGLQSNFLIAQENAVSDSSINSREFYEYLNRSGFHEDALTWLLNQPTSQANEVWICLEISKHYFALKQYAQSEVYLSKINQIKDTATLDFALGIAFINLDLSRIDFYCKQYGNLLSHSNQKIIHLLLSVIKGEAIRSEEFTSDSTLILDNELKSIVLTYATHKKKSPALAGLLSALVPGMGKLYLGYKYQAISAFTMNMALGAMLFEWISRSSSIVKWIVPLPIFTVFYTGNILGSVLLAKKMETDFKKNLNENIKTYSARKFLYRQ